MDAAHAGNERDEAGAERDEMMEEVEEQEDGYSAFSFHLVTLISLYPIISLGLFISLISSFSLLDMNFLMETRLFSLIDADINSHMDKLVLLSTRPRILL